VLTGETSIGEEVPQVFLADGTLKESGNPILVLLVDNEIPIGTKQQCQLPWLMRGERQADCP
jgi:hypothetical protein